MVIIVSSPFRELLAYDLPTKIRWKKTWKKTEEEDLQLQTQTERMSRLITGSGKLKGRGKSLEFEFAARTIVATGCSAREARDQILVTRQLFLPASKFVLFEQEVPTERWRWRWFRYQRKGLGYEAWLYSMVRVAKCESILQ